MQAEEIGDDVILNIEFALSVGVEYSEGEVSIMNVNLGNGLTLIGYVMDDRYVDLFNEHVEEIQ